MSFYTDASLVMIPSGYKTSKVYSAKPIDGTGDLTFTRTADTATRVGPDFLIEKVYTNEALYSQDFSNAAWTKSNTTITADTIANPIDGLTNASTSTPSAATGAIFQQQVLALSASTYTWSVYAKANGRQFIQLLFGGFFNGTARSNFDLINGTITGGTGGQIESIGSGWYRISLTAALSAATDALYIWNIDNGTASRGASSTGNGTDGNYLFGAQLELSDFGPTEYIPTTTAAVSVGPVANVPRLDYSGGATCPSLLLEPQRTNIAIYSEQFDNAAGWTLYNGTQVTNTNETLDPSGYYGAEKAIMGATNSATYRKTLGGLTNGDTYTFSLYIKQGSGATAFLDISDSSGVVDITPTSEWVRYTKTGVWNTALGFIDIELRGTVGSYCYIWGAQFELGAYPTSYIPTNGAAVTRGADSCSKTGISSLIGQTEGTMFVEIDWDGIDKDSMFFTLSDGTSNNRMHIGYDDGNNRFYFNIRQNNLQQATIVFNNPVAGNYKIGAAYKANDVALYINGTQIGTDTSTSVAATTRIDIGNYFSSGFEYSVKQNLLFPTRLTNAQMASLTSL